MPLGSKWHSIMKCYIVTVITVHENDTSKQNETDGEFDTHGKNKICIHSFDVEHKTTWKPQAQS